MAPTSGNGWGVSQRTCKGGCPCACAEGVKRPEEHHPSEKKGTCNSTSRHNHGRSLLSSGCWGQVILRLQQLLAPL